MECKWFSLLIIKKYDRHTLAHIGGSYIKHPGSGAWKARKLEELWIILRASEATARSSRFSSKQSSPPHSAFSIYICYPASLSPPPCPASSPERCPQPPRHTCPATSPRPPPPSSSPPSSPPLRPSSPGSTPPGEGPDAPPASSAATSPPSEVSGRPAGGLQRRSSPPPRSGSWSSTSRFASRRSYLMIPKFW